MGVVRVVALAASFAGAALGCSAFPAGAEGEAAPTLHGFAGIDATRNSGFGHLGIVWSPFDDLHTPGWRLRALVDGGRYRYESEGLRISGQSARVEIMPGRAWWVDGRGIAVFAGPTFEQHETDPYDSDKPGQGTQLGGRVLVESWARLSDRVMLDASASYATAGSRYSVRIAAGIEIRDGLVVEPEVALFGEADYDQIRMGLFARLFGSRNLQVLAGGGWAFDRDGGGPYVGLRLKSWHRARGP